MAENRYSDEQCLDALRAAAERLGRSPARREYASLGCETSATVISKRFDSWNEAKREAGLPICRGGQPPKPVNESYFEQIDAASKAYWLGFLFGDGSLVERKYGCRVQLSQRRENRSHLLKFKRTVRSENAIVEDRGTCHLRIGNPRFATNLRKHGFASSKSSDGVLPDLNTWSLKRGFVRGLADADGYYGANKWTITDNTSKRLRKLQGWIPFESDIIEERYGDRTWAYLRVSGKWAVPALYHWLFPRSEHTEPAMARKREAAVSLFADRS